MKIYALRWKQSGVISTVEAYLDEGQAQANADSNNKELNQNFFQKVLGRYWEVATINVREG